MLQPDKEPPTHTAWSQHRDRGKFREWYKRGHVWLEKTTDGQIIGCVFEGTPGPRGYDGFIYFFPNGMTPPDPEPEERAKRPGQPSDNERDT